MVSQMKHRNGMTLIPIVNMNERIKELEKQCWSHRVDGVLVDGHLHFDTQKFAELILMDVLDICEDLGDKGQDGHYCVDKIRRVFGV